MKQSKPTIKEIIIVEGRNDERAVKAAVSAEVIVTNGFYIGEKTIKLIAKAYEDPGILIFTDPDFAGEKIRKKLVEKFPKSKQAFLQRSEAEKNRDIGVENASPDSILRALSSAVSYVENKKETFTQNDLLYFDLIGSKNSKERRDKLGKILGIGYASSKTFLSRLNSFNIKKEEFYLHGQTLFSGDCNKIDERT